MLIQGVSPLLQPKIPMPLVVSMYDAKGRLVDERVR